MPPIRPKAHGLTPEAAEALNLPPNPRLADGDTFGDVADTDPISDYTFGPPLVDETGDGIPDANDTDDEEQQPRSRLRARAGKPPPPRDSAKATPPAIDEWLDFFGRIFLRVICDWYISFAFRGVDEELLSDREVDRLRMTDEERQRIAVPLAEMSHKSKVMRKHGRMIVASGGAFDAIVAFGVWTSRVNRIARKYKPRSHGRVTLNNERSGSNAPNGTSDYTQGANGGRIGDGFTIINPGS